MCVLARIPARQRVRPPGGNGWIARLERLLVNSPPDSLDRARLTYLTGLGGLEGDLTTSETDLSESATFAGRGHDAELTALARLALGRVLIFRGDITGGVRLLDEAMLAVGSDMLSRSLWATATAPPSTRVTTSSTYGAGRSGPRT